MSDQTPEEILPIEVTDIVMEDSEKLSGESTENLVSDKMSDDLKPVESYQTVGENSENEVIKLAEKSERLEDHDDLFDYDLDLDTNKDEFSDLNCGLDYENEKSECFYCEETVHGDSYSQHLTDKHSVTKNLEFLCRITVEEQKKEIFGAEAVSPEPFKDKKDNDHVVELLDVSDIESEDDVLEAVEDIEAIVDLEAVGDTPVAVLPVEPEKEKIVPAQKIKVEEPDLLTLISNKEVTEETTEEDATKVDSKRDWKFEETGNVSPILSDDEKVQQRRVSCNKCYNKHTRLEGDKCKYLRNRITRRGKTLTEIICAKCNYVHGRNQKLCKITAPGNRVASWSSQGKPDPRRGKTRVAPPRLDCDPVPARKIRTLPPSLYNNPDALASKRSRSPSANRDCDIRRRSSQDYSRLHRSPSPKHRSSASNYRSHTPEYRPSSSGHLPVSPEYRHRSSDRRSPSPVYRPRSSVFRCPTPEYHGSVSGDVCELCHKVGHSALKCPLFFCDRCSVHGHFAKFCPTLMPKTTPRIGSSPLSTSSGPLLQSSWQQDSHKAAGYQSSQFSAPSYQSSQDGANSFTRSQNGAASYTNRQGAASDFTSSQGGASAYLGSQGGASGYQSSLSGATGYSSSHDGAAGYQGGAAGYMSTLGGAASYFSSQGGDANYQSGQGGTDSYAGSQGGAAGYSSGPTDYPNQQGSEYFQQGSAGAPPTSYSTTQGSFNGGGQNYAERLKALVPLEYYISNKLSEMAGNNLEYATRIGSMTIKLLAEKNISLEYVKEFIKDRGMVYTRSLISNLIRDCSWIQQSKAYVGVFKNGTIIAFIIKYILDVYTRSN